MPAGGKPWPLPAKAAAVPDGAAQKRAAPLTRRHSGIYRMVECACSPPSGCQARSRQRRWPEGPGFTARRRGADNRTCDQRTRTQPLHLRFFAHRSSSSPSLRGFSQPLTCATRFLIDSSVEACPHPIRLGDSPRKHPTELARGRLKNSHSEPIIQRITAILQVAHWCLVLVAGGMLRFARHKRRRPFYSRCQGAVRCGGRAARPSEIQIRRSANGRGTCCRNAGSFAANFGTYSVNEADKTITRVNLAGDELKISGVVPASGTKIESVYRRAK